MILQLLPLLFFVSFIPIVYADSNPNLYVSAENTHFDNHFAGSMVVEVIVSDPDISDIDRAIGEPDVTLNGKNLRMAQATDGKWYAYFANLEKAKIADQLVLDAMHKGESLDFGNFCARSTDSAVLGTSFSDTSGIAIARSGLDGAVNGNSNFLDCQGSFDSGELLNNVVRRPKSLNTNVAASGQIGLDAKAWPLIQLFSFNDVEIKYNKAASPQQVNLQYDTIPNILTSLDRSSYPAGSEVFLTISDMQLNQDPTDEDSWTFNVAFPQKTFYYAFSESGSSAANGGTGLIDLQPSLSSLGFEDNGVLSMDLGAIATLKTNRYQPDISVTDGTSVSSQIITMIETRPNSGIFESFDTSNESVIGILSTAPRGQTATIEYNSRAQSILSGTSDAQVRLDTRNLSPGTKIPVMVTDPDQNLDSKTIDRLNVFDADSLIPTLHVGNPITLKDASDVIFYSSSLAAIGTSVPSSVLDVNSARLVIDASSVFSSPFSFEMISVDLGVTAQELTELFIDSTSSGTNWLHYDIRSLDGLEISSLGYTSISLHFGLSDDSPVMLSDSLSNTQGLLQIDDTIVSAISQKSGDAFLVIDFDSSNRGVSGTIPLQQDPLPIVIDFFSFGQKNNKDVNNAVYRFELKETSQNSGTFKGTMEYVVVNQLNIFDPSLIQSLDTISQDVRFLIDDRLLDERGISISYSDVSRAGNTVPTSSKTQINTNSGTVGFDSKSYRFGQSVQVRLTDPDLNLDSEKIDVYFTIDGATQNIDAVGDTSGGILLEILIKDIRYKRCVVDGVSYGGLAATGFTLSETGASTGVFEGSFKMPTNICNADGSKLISTAGGSLDARYYDFRDSFGNSNIFKTKSSNKAVSTLLLKPNELVLPKYQQSETITLSGDLQNAKRGAPLSISLSYPNQSISNFAIKPTSSGAFRAILEIDDTWQAGQYQVELEYQGILVGGSSFLITEYLIADWVIDGARSWTSGLISDDDFLDGVRYLINEQYIAPPGAILSNLGDNKVPDWIKTTTRWWVEDKISQKEFLNLWDFLVKKGLIRI